MRLFTATCIFLCAAASGAAAQAESALQSASQQLGAYELAYPFPSPDETRLVFQGNFDGRWQLYELTIENGAIRRLHHSSGDDVQPAWSPDGQHIAFTSNRNGNDDIYVLDLGSSQARSLAPHAGKDGHPKWSADGEWIIFNRTFDPTDVDGDADAAILKVLKDGGELQILSDTPNIETFASFSPDGQSAAFVEWIPNASGAALGDIVVVDTTSGARRNLTNSSDVFDGHPYWGPSGAWIYFNSFVALASGRSEGQVRRVDPTNGTIEMLTPMNGVSELRAIPNSDETVIYYNSGSGGRTTLHQTPIAAIK